MEEVFPPFFLIYISFLLEKEEDERSRKGATLLLAAVPGIFFGRLLSVFFSSVCFSPLSPLVRIVPSQ